MLEILLMMVGIYVAIMAAALTLMCLACGKLYMRYVAKMTNKILNDNMETEWKEL